MYAAIFNIQTKDIFKACNPDKIICLFSNKIVYLAHEQAGSLMNFQLNKRFENDDHQAY
nr:hypothetical protein [uncultured Sphingobacterium sp.]